MTVSEIMVGLADRHTVALGSTVVGRELIFAWELGTRWLAPGL